MLQSFWGEYGREEKGENKFIIPTYVHTTRLSSYWPIGLASEKNLDRRQCGGPAPRVVGDTRPV